MYFSVSAGLSAGFPLNGTDQKKCQGAQKLGVTLDDEGGEIAVERTKLIHYTAGLPKLGWIREA